MRQLFEGLVNIFDHRNADTAIRCIIKVNTKVIMNFTSGNSNRLEGVPIVEMFKVPNECTLTLGSMCDTLRSSTCQVTVDDEGLGSIFGIKTMMDDTCRS